MNKLEPIQISEQDWVHPDELFIQIAEYVHDFHIENEETLETAKMCLLDALGCGILALEEKACRRVLGHLLPGTIVPNGTQVPGTDFVLDPIQGAFNITSMIRWLDFNDTWLAKEWGHPSDNIGAILAVADCMSQQKKDNNLKPISMKVVLECIIKAYEIQGVIALENSFNRCGLDHVLLVKVASAALSSYLAGGSVDQTVSAVSNAFVDGQALRVYRHGENTGPRKSWAAGDAASRGVSMAWLSCFSGEPGYPTALSAKIWGFNDVLLHGNKIQVVQKFKTYVMDNILFKVKYPAEFHGQTAVEAAISLKEDNNINLDDIEKIEIKTQEPAIRIIDKTGDLHNYADRDHCIQYMVAVALMEGTLTSYHYSDEFAANTKIDELRSLMTVVEEPEYTAAYYDPDLRAIPNSVAITMRNKKQIESEILFPLGHAKRRESAVPHLRSKYISAIASHFDGEQKEALSELWNMPVPVFNHLTVHDFMHLFAKTVDHKYF